MNTIRLLPKYLRGVTHTRRFNTSPAFKKAIYNIPETKITTLSNGLRVATENSGIQTATIGLYIDAGSRWESAETNGTAHFLEHMIFKGTNNRSQEQLEREIENMGAHLNAYTSREHTVYFAKCLSEDIPRNMDILADILTNSKFDHEQVEREKNVILTEMEEVEKMVEEVIFDYLHKTAFQETSLSHTILGPTVNIENMSRQNLIDYVTTHYHPSRIVLSAAGGVNHDELVKLAEKYFLKLPKPDDINEVPELEPSNYTGSEIKVRDDAMPAVHAIIAVEGVGWTNENYVPMMVMSSIIGNWDRSIAGGHNLSCKLAQVCSETNWAWSFNTFNICFNETGLFGVYFVCNHMEIDNLIFHVQREWMRICTSITSVQVERAKNMLKTSLMMSLNGSTAIFEDIGRQLTIYDRRIPLAEWVHRIDMIDEKIIRNVATKYFYDKCPVVAGIGPIEAFPDYNRIRSGMFWLRT